MNSTPSPVRDSLLTAQAMDETEVVERLLRLAEFEPARKVAIGHRAMLLVERVRKSRTRFGMLDAFLREFGLSTREGIALMCVAEALLRIPDAETADALIRDKIGPADWKAHVGHAASALVNASTWALMLTGRVIRLERGENLLGKLVSRTGEPVIRQALQRAMRILGHQFVMGRTIGEALERSREGETAGYRHSFDMLGEGARTAADADRYLDSYIGALDALGKARGGRDLIAAPSLSVKLSALHPRYEEAGAERVHRELIPRLIMLCRRARDLGVAITVDAEEADRLDLSLDVIEATALAPELAGWDGLGLAIQAYQKRALAVVDWTIDLARRADRRIMVRLVKGAYWDSEIKRAQERGLPGFPVFTRKANTDASYIACARRLLGARDVIFPMFATHNAHTVATILELTADSPDGYEFQRLHGMGEPLYHQLVGSGPDAKPCRVYAPVGGHEDLLAYLVRRLLENGANSSFVNRLQDDRVPVAEIVTDPVAEAARPAVKSHPRIPLPADLFQPERTNSAGIDLSDRGEIAKLNAELARAWERRWRAASVIAGKSHGETERTVFDPADRSRAIGTVVDATEPDVGHAVAIAEKAARGWSATPAERRAEILERVADLYEAHRVELMALAIREAGKTIPDALGEVREAVDFLRYYAARARADFGAPEVMPGPTGERNEVTWAGRGVFVCISPWNFPLAIFTGQVSAALAAGNVVVAKPAEQTPLIAAKAVTLMHEAGVPPEVLHLVIGDGAVGAALVGDPRIDGVAFTGSTDTAWAINRALSAKHGPIAPLIAETGGLNAMIADSSALPEQLVDDVITSAFRSCGQRCSALRVLFLPDGSADRVIRMLAGATAELVVGDPARLSTDVGPVIDEAARDVLADHVRHMTATARPLFHARLSDDCGRGVFLAPHAFEIGSIAELGREVFGPVLHIVRYAPDRLEEVCDAIDATGYGLTLGIHSRVDATVDFIRERVSVGNIYVNRNMVGAVVGVQPFGGEGLSGTGFKAGGPRHLTRYAVERAFTVNTTAAGGNASLVSMDEDGE